MAEEINDMMAFLKTVEWTSVKDRLPDGWGNYLVCRGRELDVATFFPDSSDTWGMWQAMGHKIGDSVTHWMPLPEPPEIKPHDPMPDLVSKCRSRMVELAWSDKGERTCGELLAQVISEFGEAVVDAALDREGS